MVAHRRSGRVEGRGPIIRHMIGKLWEKLHSLFDDDGGGASEPMPEEWAEPLENAEELPGHDIQAGQIGMFS
jgi:hypothetical protein